MVAMAGSKGGFIGPLRKADAYLMNRMLSGRLRPAELEEALRDRSRPSIGLVVNNSCNLSCSHCYLQVERLLGKPLGLEEWRRFSRSAMRSGAALLSVCGKEPLLGRRGVELLEALTQVRDQVDADTRVGLITNGTLMDRHRSALSSIRPDFLDVSIEGLHALNDQVRGPDSFQRVLPNIGWAASAFDRNFFLALTIQRLNYRHVESTASYFRRRGVRKLFLSFYQAQSCSDNMLSMTRRQVEETFDALAWTNRLSPGRPFEVYVDLGFAEPEWMQAFLASRWFAPESMEVDATGMYFLRYRWRNGVTLYFRFSFFPLAFWHTARVTPEGLYLGAEDTMDTSRYEEAAVANVRDFDCDFSRLQAHALQSRRFRETMDRFWTVTAPGLVRVLKKARQRWVA